MNYRNDQEARNHNTEVLARRRSPDGTHWQITENDIAEGFGPAEHGDSCTDCGGRTDVRVYTAVLGPSSRALDFYDVEPLCLNCAEERLQFQDRNLSDEIARFEADGFEIKDAIGDAIPLARNARFLFALQRFVSRVVWEICHTKKDERQDTRRNTPSRRPLRFSSSDLERQLDVSRAELLH